MSRLNKMNTIVCECLATPNEVLLIIRDRQHAIDGSTSACAVRACFNGLECLLTNRDARNVFVPFCRVSRLGAIQVLCNAVGGGRVSDFQKKSVK